MTRKAVVIEFCAARCTRWMAATLVVLAAVTTITAAASAQNAEPFSATVSVDATADSPVKARDLARIDGQRRALNAVAEHLAASGSPPKTPKLDDKAIAGLVANFEIANERSSTVRYTAEYTFHFRPAETRRLLGSPATDQSAKVDQSAKGDQTAKPDQAAKGDQAPKAIVVLPVYMAGGQAHLWEDPNPWRQAWEQHAPAIGSARLIVPLGDAADLASIDGDKAQGGDTAALSALARRNDGADVLVAQATEQGTPDKPTALDLNLRRYHGNQIVDTHAETLIAKPGENDDALLTRAVAAIGTGLTDGWKKEAAPRYDQQGNLTAIMPISGLEDWVKARERIAGIALVKKVNLVALSRQEATIEIGYSGNIDQLKSALAPTGLTLARGDVGWRLTHAETGRSQ
jgi:hypothetical protein